MHTFGEYMTKLRPHFERDTKRRSKRRIICPGSYHSLKRLMAYWSGRLMALAV